MIAKFTLSLLSTWLSVLVWSQSISTKEFQYYFQVAADYHIHPPSLDYGYPWWYDSDDLPVTGIIFLKNDLEVTLEKLNDTAWVAEPNAANAREIYASSIVKSDRPKFIIVPDSNLTYSEIQNFIDSLCWDFINSKLIFIDPNGNYTNVLKVNTHHERHATGCGDGSSILEILINNRLQILLEGKIAHMNEVEKEVYDFYISNFKDFTSYRYFDYRSFTREKITTKIKDLQELIFQYPEDDFFKIELRKYEDMLSWSSKYGDLTKVSNFDRIRIKIFGNETKIGFYYQIHAEINSGLKQARNQASFSRFGITYSDLYCMRQFDKINFINFQMPDLVLIVEEYQPAILELP